MDRVLIATPLKDATPDLDTYLRALARLTYAAEHLSLGFLESDSLDGTYAAREARLPRLGRRDRRVGPKSRNHLPLHALDDEDWVLWLDVDAVEYLPDDPPRR